jgi:hypothetical protein
MVLKKNAHIFSPKVAKNYDNNIEPNYQRTFQIDRYISYVGQATSYKMGERHIKKVRAKFEKEAGKNFDVKRFHYLVLNCMGPLDSLEECMRLKSGPKSAPKNSARDRFNETPFRSKTFRINFHPYILDKFPAENNSYTLF